MSHNTLRKSILKNVNDAHQCHNDAVDLILRNTSAELQLAIQDGNSESISEALRRVEQSVVDRGNAHEQWCEAGRLALSVKSWDAAQRLAARSLLSYPKFGAAMRLFGDALSGLGRHDEAMSCYRFQLPPEVEIEHFGHVPCLVTTTRINDDANLRHHTAFASDNYSLKLPFQIKPVNVPELDHHTLMSTEAFVGSVPEGTLWYDGGNAVVWDNHHRLVEDISLGFLRAVHASVQSRTPVRLEGRACLLGNRSYLNYYHWMCDTLPRLEVLSQAGISLDSIDHFIVPPLKHDFHWETLGTLGIEEARIHSITHGEYIQADELFVPIFGSNSLGLRQGRWNPSFLKNTYGPSTQPAEKARRLFISRGTSGKRGICNEPELLQALEPLGFELILCENHTVAEQASLFASAEAIVGPHGAGLTNIVFCSPGTVVLELFNAHMAPCFWTVSELTDLRHAIQFCGYIDESTGLPGSSAPPGSPAQDIRRNAFEADIDGTLASLKALGIS